MKLRVGGYYTVIGDIGYSTLENGTTIKVTSKYRYEEGWEFYFFHSHDWYICDGVKYEKTGIISNEDRPMVKPATRKQIAKYKKERSLRS